MDTEEIIYKEVVVALSKEEIDSPLTIVTKLIVQDTEGESVDYVITYPKDNQKEPPTG